MRAAARALSFTSRVSCHAAASLVVSIAYSGRVGGHEPTDADMEPMSWAFYSMIAKLGAVEGMAAAVQLQAFTRKLVAFL